MEISFDCLYCGTTIFSTDEDIVEYIECLECAGLHDVEINDDGEVLIEEF